MNKEKIMAMLTIIEDELEVGKRFVGYLKAEVSKDYDSLEILQNIDTERIRLHLQIQSFTKIHQAYRKDINKLKGV